MGDGAGVLYTTGEPGNSSLLDRGADLLVCCEEWCQSSGKDSENISTSTFSNNMVRNRLTFLEFLSLGLNIPFASFHASGTLHFLQNTLRILHSRFCRSGHILYTLYGMALGLGADPNFAFVMTSFTYPIGKLWDQQLCLWWSCWFYAPTVPLDDFSTGIRMSLVKVSFNLFHWDSECAWPLFIQ